MEGRSLSDAMSKQPLIFSDLYVNMVKAGEQSGALVEVLRRMADHFEKFAAVQAKFSAALVYPAFVGVVGIGIAIFFMTYMLPKFMTLFGNMNVQLPMMTQILMNISNVFTGYWWAMLLGSRTGLHWLSQIPEHGRRQAQARRMENESADLRQGGAA